MSPALRPYQTTAIDAVRSAALTLSAPRSVCLVAPCGSGKTTIGSEIARRAIERAKLVLWVVDRMELIDQAVASLRRFGLNPGIISASHGKAEARDVTVASIDTLSARALAPLADLLIIDECFPAGTLIDGRPIETIKIGDIVSTIDHETGEYRQGRVARTSMRHINAPLMELRCGGVETFCTEDHPIFMKGHGYVKAKNLTEGDLLCMWVETDSANAIWAQTTEDLRWPRLSQQIFLDDHGQDKPASCIQADDRAQSNAQARGAGQSEGNAQGDRPQAANQDGQWSWANQGGDRPIRGSGHRLAEQSDCKDEDATRQRISESLQARSGPSWHDDRNRSGWIFTLRSSAKGTGQKERRVLAWVRLDHIARQEPGSTRGTAVYNFEVEGSHTYFANEILVHNCHHAPSDSYSRFLEQYQAQTIVGLTATPERGDGQGLAPLFKAMVVASSIRELTEQGYLVPCEVIAPASFLPPGKIAQRPVDAYREHAAGRSAIVFSPTIKAGQIHAQEFRDAGIDCEFIDGATETNERRARIESFAAGYYPVIVNCGVLVEGTDIPRASCAILARGCGTEGLYLQITGRILRTHESKTDALLLDLRGVSSIHGRPAEDRKYSLHGRAITHGPEAGAVYCRTCGAIRTPPDPCAECGTEGDSAKPLRVVNEPLIRYAGFNRRPAADLTMSLAKFMLEARQKGWKPKQPLVKWRSLTGLWPSRAIQAEAQRLMRELDA